MFIMYIHNIYLSLYIYIYIYIRVQISLLTNILLSLSEMLYVVVVLVHLSVYLLYICFVAVYASIDLCIYLCTHVYLGVRLHVSVCVYVYYVYVNASVNIQRINVAVDQNLVFLSGPPHLSPSVASFVAAGCFKPFVVDFSRL